MSPFHVVNVLVVSFATPMHNYACTLPFLVIISNVSNGSSHTSFTPSCFFLLSYSSIYLLTFWVPMIYFRAQIPWWVFFLILLYSCYLWFLCISVISSLLPSKLAGILPLITLELLERSPSHDSAHLGG